MAKIDQSQSIKWKTQVDASRPSNGLSFCKWCEVHHVKDAQFYC